VPFAKPFDKTPSEDLGFASSSIVDYDLVFKPVWSVTLSNLI
jgi:hypothetical protein